MKRAPRTTGVTCLALAMTVVMFQVGTALAEAEKVPTVERAVSSVAAPTTPPEVTSSTIQRRSFVTETSDADLSIIRWDRDLVRAASQQRRDLVVNDFSLPGRGAVELELEPFHITGPNARFVVGTKGKPDRPVAFDPSSISLFRGKISGRSDSHVFLALSDQLSTGYIDLGGSGRYQISHKGRHGRRLAPGRISVFEPIGAANLPPGVPLCGVEGAHPLEVPEHVEFGASPRPPEANVARSAAPSTIRVKHMELAVDSDYEYFTLFGDEVEATAYLFVVYGAVSDTYLRDVDTHIELVFTRVWTDPDDLYNGGDPLQELWPEWENNMGHVHRDAVQLFSGRRNYPFGGQAYLSQLCAFAYGVVGYAVGFMPDPSKPHPFNYDVDVTAHELGHTSGTGHTHDDSRLAPNFIDTCNDPNTTPQRGSIMSYCGQTWSGGNANRDNYFHTRVRVFMNDHIGSSACIVDDCNMNNIADSIDIAGPTSVDTNLNGIPDECEDCNGNGTLDPVDILGASLDLNANNIPDECEPDCNGNSIPDDKDIADGTSSDAYGNGIPDECEEDCNTNGISDYTEIQANMPLDVDRNAVLDSCQDCDSNGTTDQDVLAGSHHMWVASGLGSSVLREFYPTTGVLVRSSSPAPSALVNEGQDVIVTAGGAVLVTSAADSRVVRFDTDGNYLGDFVSSGSGGLSYPTGLIMSPGGALLVSSRNTNEVLAYDGVSGAPLGAFVPAGAAGLIAPFGLTFGPNGNLYVTSATNEVLKYDGVSGAILGKLVGAANNGGLDQPRGLTFKPDGNLLIASYGTDEVLEFDGRTGAPLGKWAQVGTATRLTQDSPWGVHVGPNGHVFVSRTGTDYSSGGPSASLGDLHLTDARMFEFNVCNGDYRRTHIGGNDHGLNFTTGFDFIRGFDDDCNVNHVPDSCDISSGFSTDTDTNGVPDECDVDCNGNGLYDRLDIIPYGTSYDCNCNFIPDECDIATGFSQDCDGNGIADECEDCNGNGIGDACDISSGTSGDCNDNALPDDCEPDTDCNANGVADICDLANGTSSDCDNNGTPDTCDTAGGGLIIDVDFESGLPAGWTTTGIFQVSTSCAVNPTCDGIRWAQAGSTTTCSYGNNQVGELTSPPIALAPVPASLEFCTMVNTEAGFDFATVLVNGEVVYQESGPTAQWEPRTIDITRFGGQSVVITFRLVTDGLVTAFGWQVDNIRVTSGSEDCDGNGVPDVCDPDCDGDGIPNGCDSTSGCVCAPSSPPQPSTPGYAKNRYLSFTGGNAGEQTAVRVTFVDLPAPFDTWNGRQMWVAEPEDVSELGGLTDSTPPTFKAATLTCVPPAPFYTDWTTLGAVHVYHEGVVPGGVYDIQEIDIACLTTDLIGYSGPLSLTNARWADVCGSFDSIAGEWTAPNGTVNVPSDIVSIVDRFRSLPGAPIKTRVDIDPATPDRIINITDITRGLDAFRGLVYPFVPGPPPCP